MNELELQQVRYPNNNHGKRQGLDPGEDFPKVEFLGLQAVFLETILDLTSAL